MADRFRVADEAEALWFPVERQVLTATATTIDFSSIDTSLTALRIIARLRCQGTHTISARLNNDSGSNYHDLNVVSGAAGAAQNSQTELDLVSLTNSGADEASLLDMLILKPESDLEAILEWRVAAATSSSVEEVDQGAGEWANTADLIDQVTLISSVADSFKVGTRVTLLGSKAL